MFAKSYNGQLFQGITEAVTKQEKEKRVTNI